MKASLRLPVLILFLALVQALFVERAVVSQIDREGGVLFEYDIHADEAIKDERDRRYEELRDALATALGLHTGDGQPTLQELRALRSKVRVDKARDRGDTIILTFVDEDAAARVDDAFLKRSLGAIEITREADQKRITCRIPAEMAELLQAHAVSRLVETMRRRLAALKLSGFTVDLRDGRLLAAAPLYEDLAIAEVRDIIGQTGRLEFKMVDDEVDFFEPIFRNLKSEDLPSGLSYSIENAPVGPGKTKPVRYARLIKGEDEDMQAARKRLAEWISTLEVDPDHEIGIAKFQEYDEEKELFEEKGYRTYYLFSKAEITGDMVRDAMAQPTQGEGPRIDGWHVAMELTPSGGARFEEITGKNVKRRFAIILDGKVESAPQILAKIPGGHAQITMGKDSPEQQMQDARKLELVLRSGALPVPVSLSAQRRLPPLLTRLVLDRALLGAAPAMLILLGVLFVHDRRKAVKKPTP